MPLFGYDRSLPVTPRENVNDVQAMFGQLRNFMNGEISGDNLAANAITGRELANQQAVGVDELSPALARRWGLQRTGAQKRRQVDRKLNVPVTLGGGTQILASHSYTNEVAGDHILFTASFGLPSVAQEYDVVILLDGASTTNSYATVIGTGDTVALEDQGAGSASQFRASSSKLGGMWHLVPFTSLGQTRTVAIACNPITSSATIGEVFLQSMMLELG